MLIFYWFLDPPLIFYGSIIDLIIDFKEIQIMIF